MEDSADRQWGTRDVVGTHKLAIKVGVDEGFAYICSMEDNLGKGAASQAVENLNLMFGLPRLYGIDGVLQQRTEPLWPKTRRLPVRCTQTGTTESNRGIRGRSATQ